MTLSKYYIPLALILLALLLVRIALPLPAETLGVSGKIPFYNVLPDTVGEIVLPDSVLPDLPDSLPAKDTVIVTPVSVPLLPDSVPLDVIVADSADLEMLSDSTPPRKKADLDAPVVYIAKDSIIFEFDSTTIARLFGESKVDYIVSQLEAEIISMDMDHNTVHAIGRPDSTGLKRIGDPIFTDKGTPYYSDSIAYNFKTGKGYILNLRTNQGDGLVTSLTSKKDSLDNIYMKGGRYTTCDLEHPDFYIALTRAKVIPKKNVVFGPAYLVIQDVPLPLAIPFGFFPFTSSYSSGFLMPSYGEEMERGFYLSDGGYYWAISDYMDLKLTGQIYTKGSWGINAASNYNKRYKYSGNFNLNYLYTVTGEKNMPDYATSRDFKVQWSHRQDTKAKPNSSFSASVNFSTSSYEHSNIGSYYNPGIFSQNTKTSSISYTRSFPDQKLTMSTGLNISQTSKDSTITVSFPSLSVSMSSIYPFRKKKTAGAEQWYEKINLRYSGLLSNSITTKENKFFKSNLIKDWKNGIKHEIPVSASFTLFNYLNITPSINYTERWYSYKVKESRKNADSEVVRDTIYGFNRVYNYSASISLSTKLYGMYTPMRSIFGDKIRQIRHVFTPSVSFTAAPDFGARSYGYYETYSYIDAYGEEQIVEYSPYDKQVHGIPGKGKIGTVAFNVSNNLEMKVRSRSDSTGIKKVSLIDELGLGLSYNMAAKTRPWSDLSMRLRLKFPGTNYTFNLSTQFATYAYQFDEKGEVYVGERTEWSYGRFGRFTGTSFSYSYTFNNGTWKQLFKKKGSETDSKPNSSPNPETGIQAEEVTEGDPAAPKRKEEKAEVDDEGYGVFHIPWSFSVSYSCRISENRQGVINPKTMRYPYRLNHTLSGSGTVKFSNKWNVSFSTSYDFDAHEIATTTFNISRDLHCFSMSCSLTPFGRWRSYNFIIQAKSSLLQDLKWEQRSSYSNNIQWY